jgi:hypothetical protein
MSSKAHLPPVPPANRPRKGGGQPGDAAAADTHEGDMAGQAAEQNQEAKDRNLASQGRQGNVAVNTRNQGYQQDR